MKKIFSLIRKKMGIRVTQEKLTYQLENASKQGDLTEVRRLVDLGADIHAFSDFALQVAAAQGHLEIVKYLVFVGADIHAFSDNSLNWAASKGRLEVVKYLISIGADYSKNSYQRAKKSNNIEVASYIKMIGDPRTKKLAKLLYD